MFTIMTCYTRKQIKVNSVAGDVDVKRERRRRRGRKRGKRKRRRRIKKEEVAAVSLLVGALSPVNHRGFHRG